MEGRRAKKVLLKILSSFLIESSSSLIPKYKTQKHNQQFQNSYLKSHHVHHAQLFAITFSYFGVGWEWKFNCKLNDQSPFIPHRRSIRKNIISDFYNKLTFVIIPYILFSSLELAEIFSVIGYNIAIKVL